MCLPYNYHTNDLISLYDLVKLTGAPSGDLGTEKVEWIQQYVSITLLGISSTMQSMGSPMYCLEVTSSEQTIRMMKVACV